MNKQLAVAAAAALALGLAACKDKESKQPEAPVEIEEVEYLDAAHNSQNSLDWAGAYKGTIPCANCEGIVVEIAIGEDGKYTKTDEYLGKPDNIFRSEGTFAWTPDGGTIVLEGEQAPNRYKVGENVLFKLDMDGSVIDGELAGNYLLHKVR